MTIQNLPPRSSYALAASGLKWLPFSMVTQAASVAFACLTGWITKETAWQFAGIKHPVFDLSQMSLSEAGGRIFATMVSSTILVGTEEFIFREVLQGKILKESPPHTPCAIPKLARIMISALTFSAYHLQNSVIGIRGEDLRFQLSHTFGLGLSAAVLKEASGSVWPAVGLHLASNVFSVARGFFASYGILAKQPGSSWFTQPDPRKEPNSCPLFERELFVHPTCPKENQAVFKRFEGLEEPKSLARHIGFDPSYLVNRINGMEEESKKERILLKRMKDKLADCQNLHSKIDPSLLSRSIQEYAEWSTLPIQYHEDSCKPETLTPFLYTTLPATPLLPQIDNATTAS